MYASNDLVCNRCGTMHHPCVDCGDGLVSDSKKDTDKIDYTLIPPEVLKLAAKLLTTGAKIHGADSWKTRVGSNDRQLKSLYRHLEARRAGNFFDDGPGGTGSLHSAAVLVNAIMLVYFDIQETWYDEKLGGVNDH